MTPNMIYPACEILENAMRRFRFCWRIANMLAIVIEAIVTQ